MRVYSLAAKTWTIQDVLQLLLFFTARRVKELTSAQLLISHRTGVVFFRFSFQWIAFHCIPRWDTFTRRPSGSPSSVQLHHLWLTVTYSVFVTYGRTGTNNQDRQWFIRHLQMLFILPLQIFIQLIHIVLAGCHNVIMMGLDRFSVGRMLGAAIHRVK